MVGTSGRPWSILSICNPGVLQGLPVPPLAVQPQKGGA